MGVSEDQKAKHSEYVKGLRNDRMKLGLCPVCGKSSPTPGRVTCGECGKRQAENTQRSRDRYKLRSVCQYCGIQKPEGFTLICKACRLRKNETKRELTKKRLLEGKCKTCGENVTAGNWCDRCYFRIKARVHLGTMTRWEELKAVWAEQGGVCPYTGVELVLAEAHLDHKIPLAKGGTAEVENLQWVYAPVNYMKWDFDEDLFLKHVEKVYLHCLKSGRLLPSDN